MTATLVIGIGNEFRGDDGAGLAVARQLAERNLAGVDIREAGGEALSLMGLWRNARCVILIDALAPVDPPGGVVRFDASREPLPAASFPCSTHAFSLAEAIELARVSERLPPDVIVYGIPGRHFEHGAPLSAVAREGVAEAVARIIAECA